MRIGDLSGCLLVGLLLTGGPLAGQGADPGPSLPDSPPATAAGPALPGPAGGSAGQGTVPMAVLVLDVEQAYVSSAWGKRAQINIEAAAREIEAENIRMEAQLVAEEQALARERDSLSAADFRHKAEAFDTRAQTVRRDRRQAAVDLGNRAQADRNAFLDATLPVIAGMMQERAAGLVLDRRQVLAAVNAVDVTQDLVERMDQQIGDGGQLPEVPAPGAGGDAAAGDDAGLSPLDAPPITPQP